MAKSIAKYTVHDVQGATLLAAQAANWVKGVFVGVDSAGKARPADYRASQGPIVALGVALQDAQQKDPKGNVIDTLTEVSWARTGVKVAGMTAAGGGTLTAGAIYYLSSGGAIQSTKPGSTNDINQVVGVALSTTELELLVSTPIVV